MSKKHKKKHRSCETSIAKQQPRSLAYAEAGVRTGGDFAGMMSALMSDTIAGRISPQVTNATVNAGGKLLKVVELQLKYGAPGSHGARKELQLIPDTVVQPAEAAAIPDASTAVA